MRNTKKTQEKKYSSAFLILDKGLVESSIEPFYTLDDAIEYVNEYINDDNSVIVEYTPTAVLSPPKKTEWVKESLIE